MQYVPADVRVRPSRVRNIDTDRLERRLTWLMENKNQLAKEADSRMDLRHIAREIITIERELQRRKEQLNALS